MSVKKPAENKELTPIQKLQQIVNEQQSYFIRWYLANAEDREPFDKYSAKFLTNKTLDFCTTWLLDDRVQKGIKLWMGLVEQQNLIKLYKSMYEKALGGSTDAANWILKFKDSGYFKDDEGELTVLLKGVKIPEDTD